MNEEDQENICSICNSEIGSSPHRIIVLRDKLKNPLILRFHYFFPCWDLNLLTQKYQDYELIDAGFRFELEKVEENTKFRNLRENTDLWV